MSKVQELETTISCLEADKTKLISQLTEARRDLADREAQNVTLETRINQRNTQLIELQEQINQKCTDVTTVEREVGHYSVDFAGPNFCISLCLYKNCIKYL